VGKKRPTHEIKLGRIRAAIWSNESGDSDPWFNVTVTRLFQDKADGSWRDSNAFGRDDLPIANKAMDMAYGWILRHEQKLEMQARQSSKKNEE